MNIRRILTMAMAVLAVLALCCPASALDLRKKKVKGVEYYYYKVKKGESLYGIAKNLGMTVDEIVNANPGYADGVRKGDVLLFPVGTAAPEVALPEDTVAAAEEVAEVVHKPAVAVLMPFGLKNAAPSRRNKLSLDFYKGFLIGADSLRNRKCGIEIVARDTEGLSEAELAGMLTGDSVLSKAKVYVGPDDDATLATIATAARVNRAYVFNVLNIKDTTYVTNPWMLQGNAPQHVMYRLAVDGLMAEYPGYRPVILRSLTGKNEKEPFTAYLTERYAADGVEPVVLEYETNLLSADLEVLPVAAGEKYVFVPSSGALAEFNRFAYVLRSYRDRLKTLAAEAFDTAAENGTEPAPFAMAEVFGYPDWTAFRGEALEVLHRLNATIYSRFYDDFDGFFAKKINDDFRRWYGSGIIESIPSYGLLGYDTASYLLRNLGINGGEFDPVHPQSFTGIQSAFDFRRDGEGYDNNSIYIINYQTGGTVNVRIQ